MPTPPVSVPPPPPPPPPSSPWDRAPAAPPPRHGEPRHAVPVGPRTIGACLAGAVAGLLVVRGAIDGLGGTLAVMAVVGGLLASGTVRSNAARAAGAAACLVSVFLTLRRSPWVVGLDVVAIVALLGACAALSSGGVVLDLRAREVVRRGSALLVHVGRGPRDLAWAATSRSRSSGRLGVVVRGAALAAPLVVVLALLLASGDVVFANVMTAPLSTDSLGPDLVAAAFGAALVAALVSAAASPDPVPDGCRGGRGGRIGTGEASVVLGIVALVLGAYVAVQAVTALGGADHVLRTEGLTYAEYAREGFFSLLAASAITLAVVLALAPTMRAAAGKVRRLLVVSGEVVLLLTLVLVGLSVRKLGLYEAAFGATMLRLASTVVALLLGAVLVAAAVAITRPSSARRWLPAIVGLLAIGTLVGWNTVDPESVVAARNLDRAVTSGSLDAYYLTESLGDDALPELAARFDELDVDDRRAIALGVCLTVPDEPHGLAWNRSSARAADAREVICADLR